MSITDTYILKYMLSNLYYQIQIPIQIYNLYSHIFSSCVPCLYPHIYISIPKSKYQFFILTFFSSCVPCLYPYVYILIPKTKYQINILTFFSSYQNPNLKLIFWYFQLLCALSTLLVLSAEGGSVSKGQRRSGKAQASKVFPPFLTTRSCKVRDLLGFFLIVFPL